MLSRQYPSWLALRDPDRKVRRTAIRVLRSLAAKYNVDEATASLTDALKHGDPIVRLDAAELLVEILSGGNIARILTFS